MKAEESIRDGHGIDVVLIKKSTWFVLPVMNLTMA